MNILVIEDDPGIAFVVTRGLEKAGFSVEVEREGQKGLEKARHGSFDLIILDLMLPVLDGFAVAEALRREKRNVPILMLTARDSVDDKVKGLDAGADDYLPKPFDLKELLARVRALLRRERQNRSQLIQVADLEIDCSKRSVTRSGVPILLSKREYDLLEALAAHEGRILTREIIQFSIWSDRDSLSNTVDVYIGSLRKKIDSGSDRKLIHTVRGVGYCLKVADPDEI